MYVSLNDEDALFQCGACFLKTIFHFLPLRSGFQEEPHIYHPSKSTNDQIKETDVSNNLY